MQVRPGNTGRLILNAGADAPSQGYLPTLLQQALVADAEKNVESLKERLKEFKAYEEGGEVGSLQVGQVELQLLQGRRDVLQADKDQRDALDSLKQQLGLPVDVPIALDDPPSRRSLASSRASTRSWPSPMPSSSKWTATTPWPRRNCSVAGSRSCSRNRRWPRAEAAFRAGAAREQVGGVEEDPGEGEYDGTRKAASPPRELAGASATTWKWRGRSSTPSCCSNWPRWKLTVPYGEMELALRRYETEPWKILPDEKDRPRLHSSHFREVRKGLRPDRRGIVQRRPRPGPRRQWDPLPPLVMDGVDLLERKTRKKLRRCWFARGPGQPCPFFMNNRAEVHDVSLAAGGYFRKFIARSLQCGVSYG